MDVSRLTFEFVDNNDAEGRTSVWLPASLSLASVQAAANNLRSVILPLTSARLVRAVWRLDFPYDDTPPADTNADVRQRLICLFKDNVKTRSFAVPSPAQLPFDVAGAYSGVRLQRDSILLSPVLSHLQLVAANIVDVDGTAFPANFVVGGVTRT